MLNGFFSTGLCFLIMIGGGGGAAAAEGEHLRAMGLMLDRGGRGLRKKERKKGSGFDLFLM